MKQLELYLHIPFCAKKCAYCDFLSEPAGRKRQHEYVKALEKEIELFPYNKEKYHISTVFFGGGTPSLLRSEQIVELMERMKNKFIFEEDAEVSIECNPGTADERKFLDYRRAGINRISFGLQSAENGELKKLRRIHTWEDFLETYRSARNAGFENINVDLMSALPGQTEATWAGTLEKVLELKPEHVSAYSLIIEEGTPFYDLYQEDDARRQAGEQPLCLPSEEEERAMYAQTEKMLTEAGMHRYEISNYAVRGRECRHNIGYWRGTDYVGFGLGASSLLDHVRYRNTSDMDAYLTGDYSGREREILSKTDQMEEFMFLGLRMMNGVSEDEFCFRFGETMNGIYGKTIRKLEKQGLLKAEGGRVFLTSRGIDVSNTVMAEFLLQV